MAAFKSNNNLYQKGQWDMLNRTASGIRSNAMNRTRDASPSLSPTTIMMNPNSTLLSHDNLLGNNFFYCGQDDDYGNSLEML